MSRRARVAPGAVIALLCASAIPLPVRAHVEGVEVSDPNTPAALLALETAAARYTALETAPLPWRASAAGGAGSGGHEPAVPPAQAEAAHAGHGGAAHHSPPMTRQ